MSKKSFQLVPDLFMDGRANVTYKGRALSVPEKKDVLQIMETEFLEAFHNLRPERKAAVRLRYGQNTYRWYREEEEKEHV